MRQNTAANIQVKKKDETAIARIDWLSAYTQPRAKPTHRGPPPREPGAAAPNSDRGPRWTTTNRADRLGKGRRRESSGDAMAGRTVFVTINVYSIGENRL